MAARARRDGPRARSFSSLTINAFCRLFLDLLVYHHSLRRFVVIELKVGGFKPEYVSRMNFHLNAVDEQLRARLASPSRASRRVGRSLLTLNCWLERASDSKTNTPALQAPGSQCQGVAWAPAAAIVDSTWLRSPAERYGSTIEW